MSKPSLAPVIAVLNLKGGVGKTTISAHVMRVLYQQRSAATLLVDLDPQFNLTQAVVVRSVYDKLRLSGRTVFSAMEPASTGSLFEVDTTSQNPVSADTVVHRLRNFKNPTEVRLDLLPGDFKLVKYSMIRDANKLDLVQARFLRFIGETRKKYDLICIDCNPSSSFITSCALHACSHLLVPVRPDRYSVLGLELLADLLEEMPSIQPKPEILVLLNAVHGDANDTRIEHELRAHNAFGSKVLASKLRFSGILKASGQHTGFATDRKVAHKKRLRNEISALVAELSQALGI
jgi:chromosome partitioning protein